jgi:predicted Zn-dependent protease
MIDGLAILRGQDGQLTRLTNRQEGIIEARASRKTRDDLSTADIINTIDWALYYPDIMDVADLRLPPSDTAKLQKSLDWYRSGASMAALTNALAAFESEAVPTSASAKLYLAALRLNAGQVRQAEEALKDLESTDDRIRRLAESIRQSIAAVKLGVHARTARPEWATEWMAESYYQQSRALQSKRENVGAAWESSFYSDCDRHADRALRRARKAAEQATQASPQFGLAWARLAELEFSFGNTDKAGEYLDKVLGPAPMDYSKGRPPDQLQALAPNDAKAHALRGFLLMAKNKMAAARRAFEEALARDGALANGWLGLGLTQLRSGDTSTGRQNLQMAAAQEPQSSLYRSYLGKALHHAATTSANRWIC